MPKGTRGVKYAVPLSFLTRRPVTAAWPAGICIPLAPECTSSKASARAALSLRRPLSDGSHSNYWFVHRDIYFTPQYISTPPGWCQDSLFRSPRPSHKSRAKGLFLFLIRACLKIVNTPNRRLFFRHTSPIFLEIHPVFLRQIGFAWRKNNSPLVILPIFKQRPGTFPQSVRGGKIRFYYRRIAAKWQQAR